MDNPLLESRGLPRYSAIRPDHVRPAVEQVLHDNRRRLADLLAGEPRDWDSLVPTLDRMDEALQRTWAPVTHLNAVRNSAAMREAHNAMLPALTEYETELSQHAGLQHAFRALAEAPEFASLPAAQQKYIRDGLRDFRLAGVDLPAKDKSRFRELARRLAELGTRFEENVLDTTDAWELPISDAARLAGIPAGDRERFAARARETERSGWVLGLDFPGYFAVMLHADDRELRETVYRAFTTRASDQGPHDKSHDNTPVMREILALRAEMAMLVGLDSFAAYSLADKMAESPARVIRFLEDLAARIKPQAEKEFATLQDYARTELGLERLEAWDVAWAGEKLRKARYDLSQEELRPYFPVPRVIEGLFELLGRLYGLRFAETDNADVWHPDVKLYEIRNADGSLRGHLYMDLYARPRKRSGAWMDEALNRTRRGGRLQQPVAHLVCNFAPPGEDRPACLTHDDVQTLFHECGHCLHHLLTEVEVEGLAGIHGVEWDAVELPSQFHENFAWQQDIVRLISGHVDSGEPLPEELFRRMQNARHFQTGMKLVRQLEFALFDMRLHMPAEPPDVETTLTAVRDAVAVVQPPAWNRFANSFSHIFAGGYAAGYYSYLWAEVMSSEAFAAFEENGIFDPDTGRRFRQSILARGGSAPAGELFREFRGRDAGLDAFLRHNAIGEQAA